MFTPEAHPFNTLKLSLEDKILTVSLNRPVQKNRVNLAMVRELQQVVSELAFDTEGVRVVVLKGAGGGFSAGFEGIQINASGAALDQNQDLINTFFARSFQCLPQPVIALVHGYCTQESVALLALCDVAFASADCVFGDTAMSAAQARAQDWITHDFPPPQLELEVDKLAREWLAKDPSALQLAKESLRHVRTLSWDAVLSYTVGKQAELKALQAHSATARSQAVQSFLSGKSKPGLGS